MAVTPHTRANPAWLPAALDYAPLLIFFLGYKFAGVMTGTALFMAAIAVAVVLSKWRLGRISPMMWISAVLVIVFGGLTLWFNDFRFIQHKPTVIYSILAAMLFIGLARGQSLLKHVLEHGYDGLTNTGWMILSRNWAWFFLFMAVLNEALIATLSENAWMTVKVWGGIVVTLLFAAANVPMLMRHGLGAEKDSEVPTPSQG